MATLYYRPYTSDPITDGELAADTSASAAAAAGNTPVNDYGYIFPAPPSVRRKPAAAAPTNHSLSHTLIPKLQATGQDYVTLLDGQLGEIEKYKDAMRKMGQDILALRERVRELELKNSRLRTDLGNYADTAKILHDSVELDGIPKNELITRYLTLKRRLTSTQSQVGEVKQKVHRLQQELIGSGQPQQQQLQQLSSAHASQQQLLQQLQDRVARLKQLEETCAKQELSIERMEQQLRSQRASGGQKEEAAAARLTEENRQLRQQLSRLREAEAEAATGMEASERLELYQLLDKAESRVAALQAKLEADARSHRREKSDLMHDIEDAERNATTSKRQQQQHRNRRRRRDPAPVPQLFALPVPVGFSQRGVYQQESSDSYDDEYDDDDDVGGGGDDAARRRRHGGRR